MADSDGGDYFGNRSDTPWTIDHDAGGFRLFDFSQITSTVALTSLSPPMMLLSPTITCTTGSPQPTLELGSVYNLNGGTPNFIEMEISGQINVNVATTNITGMLFFPVISGDGVSAVGSIFGGEFKAGLIGANTITNLIGVYAWAFGQGGANVTQARAIEAEVQALTTATLTTGVGLDVVALASGGGTITTMIGIRANLAAGTTKIGGLFGSPVAITADGTATNPTASSSLDLQGVLGALLCPRMTTTQKNALSATNGMVVYDTDLAQLQGFVAGAWIAL